MHAVGDVRRGRAEQLGDEREPPGPGRRDHGNEPGEARGGGHEREQEGGARGARGRAVGTRHDPHTNAACGGRPRTYGVRRAGRRGARSTLLRDGRDRAAHAGVADRRAPTAARSLREGRSSRRQRPFWAVTLRAVDGPAAGVHAELRLWPESNLGLVPGAPRAALRQRSGVDRGALGRRAARPARAQPGRALVRRHPRDGGRRPRRRRLPRGPAPARRAPRPICRSAPLARRVPPPPDVPESAPSPPALRARRGRGGARRAVRAAGARGRARGRHRDRLRAAGRSGRLVAGRRRGAPAAGGGALRGRDRVRRRRLLRGRAAAAAAAARRRPRDHRPQRALRAGLADVPLRPARLALGLRHELRVPHLRAPLVDPGSRPTSAATPRSRPSRGGCSARPRATHGPDWWGAEPLAAATSSTTPPTTPSR